VNNDDDDKIQKEVSLTTTTTSSQQLNEAKNDGMESKADDNDNSSKSNHNSAKVSGAFKNLISGERMFLKSYIQLWCSKTDPTVRSHVFCYDRPCYPAFDRPGEISLYHKDGNVVEEIKPIIHFNNDSEISHLVMDILWSMSREVIPECLGHNYPLFLADKKAKTILLISIKLISGPTKLAKEIIAFKMLFWWLSDEPLSFIY
jgi:hypothetical protein